jgi:hypothetical protein
MAKKRCRNKENHGREVLRAVMLLFVLMLDETLMLMLVIEVIVSR